MLFLYIYRLTISFLSDLCLIVDTRLNEAQCAIHCEENENVKLGKKEQQTEVIGNQISTYIIDKLITY